MPPPGRSTPLSWPGPGDGDLYTQHLPARYFKLAQPLGITGTLVVEASSWIEDNDWVLALAEKEKTIIGLVGNFDEVWDDPVKFDAALGKYAKNPLFRGIRIRDPVKVRAAVNPGTARENLRKLAATDRTLDVLYASFVEIEKVAAAVPTLRIVINAMGFPAYKVVTPADPAWVMGLEAVAKHPNVFMKVVGVLEVGPRNGMASSDVEKYRAVLDAVWRVFGPDRLIYGNNWPVSDGFAPLASVHAVVKDYFAAKGRIAEEKFFSGNAARVYKWVGR